MGLDAMILVFWMLSFKPTFSLFSFTFIKKLFSSSSLSAIRVVSYAYLRLLIFLPEIFIPACTSSSPVFLVIYSSCKLNKLIVHLRRLIFLISPYYSLVLCIRLGISFCFSFAFCFSSFLSYLYDLLRQPFCPSAFLFLGGGFSHCFLYNVMNLHP